MTGFTIFSAAIYFAVLSLFGSTLLSEAAAIIINSAITFALFKIGLGFLDSRQLNKPDLFGTGELLVKYIVASLLFWVMVYVGLLLLIVPGIYILLTYGFFGLEMIDRNLGPLDAFARSADITKGVKWSLLRLGLEFYCGLFAINVLLFILVLFPFVSLGVMAVFLQAMHLSVFSSISPVFIEVVPAVVISAMTLLDAVIVIPAYALIFTSFYRFLEPGRVQANAIAIDNMQGSDGKVASIEPTLPDSINDRPPENGAQGHISQKD
jgi:hypothetical protein